MWDEALEGSMEEHLLKDPTFSAWLVQTKRALQAGGFPKEIVDAVFQRNWRGTSVSLVDTWGFAQVWACWRAEELAIVSVEVGGPPHGDSVIETNNALLKQAAEPFQGEFRPERGRGASCDGSFWWSEPIHLSLAEGGRFGAKKGGLPLEVGSTTAATTLGHIRGNGGVARWPYGSNRIIVLLRTGPAPSLLQALRNDPAL
jgi:hypothetical protein